MNFKGSVVAVLIVLLISAVLIATAGSAVAKEEQVVLKLSHPVPSTGFVGEYYAFFAKAVEEETKGEVKIQVYPSSSLVSDPEAFDAVRKGIVDIAHFASVTVSPKAKALIPFDIPSAYPGEKPDERDKATRTLLNQIFAKFKVKFIGPAYPETLAFAAIKNIKVKSPEDLQGKSVRVSGRWAGEAVKMWGGSPVAIPLGDLPAALQRGAVDVVLTAWLVHDSFKLYETAPNITFTKLQNILTGLIMSEKAWNSLNSQQQQAVMRAEQRWQEYMNNHYHDLRSQFEDRIVQSGGTFYDLSPEQNSAFKSVRQSLLDKVKPNVGPDGTAILNALDSIQ